MTPTSSLEHLATERLGSACAGWDKRERTGLYSILLYYIQSKKPAKENQSEPPSPSPPTPGPCKNPYTDTNRLSLLFSSTPIYIYIYTKHSPPGFFFTATHRYSIHHEWMAWRGGISCCLSERSGVWGRGRGRVGGIIHIYICVLEVRMQDGFQRKVG